MDNMQQGFIQNLIKYILNSFDLYKKNYTLVKEYSFDVGEKYFDSSSQKG